MSRQLPIATITNLDDYAHPAYYDLENRDFTPQGPFYLALARQVGDPVLELGCGTGRMTIPLAQQGITITGIDAGAGMLAHARLKAGDLPIHWIEADARTFQLSASFRLIFGTTGIFQHMLERADQEALLDRVRAHLAPDGYFAFDVHAPRAAAFAEQPEEIDWFSYLNDEGQEVRVSGTCHYDAIRQVNTETAYRCWRDAQGQVITHRAPLSLRYFYPRELESLLHYNGFSIIEQYGEYDRSPLMAESQHIISICQRRSSL
jgi:SAM-dependent methyltransferase